MKALLRPCAFCREDIPARAAVCPRCGERQPVPEASARELIAWTMAGAAIALVAVATIVRILAGPLSAPAAAEESLHFVELGVAACFLLLLALLLRRG